MCTGAWGWISRKAITLPSLNNIVAGILLAIISQKIQLPSASLMFLLGIALVRSYKGRCPENRSPL